MKTNIIISPSQQINNQCIVGDSEADHCRIIAEKVIELLKKYECNVWLIPEITGDEADILQKVVNSSNYFCKTNPSDADYHLSLHTDGGYNAKGASAFYLSEGGKAFIQHIHKAVAKLTPDNDGGVTKRDLMELSETVAIAGYLEMCFHDKILEAQHLHTYIDLYAKAIVDGFVVACELVLKAVTEITDIDDAIQMQYERGIINNIEFRKKVCDTTMFEKEYVLSVANYIAKNK